MQDMPQFAEIPDSVRNMVKASIDQTRKAFETFIGSSQKAMMQFEGPSPAATESIRQLNDKIAEFTRQNADANFRLAMKLTDAKQLNEVLEIQNQHVRDLMNTYAKQLEELRDLTMRMMKDTTQSAASMMPKMPGT
jgi:hypothetical protein